MRSLWLLLLLSLLGCPDPPPPQPEVTFSVHLVDVGPNRDAVVACVVSIRSCNPKIAAGLVDRLRGSSLLVKAGLGEAEAQAAKAALEREGASAALFRLN